MLYAVVGIYFALMLAIGIITALKIKTIQDFFLGNRTVGPWISAFAYGTTYFSAVLFIGYAGPQGWSFGLPILWVAAGNSIGITKADAPMYGSLAMLASVVAVALVSLLLPAKSSAAVDRAFATAGAAKEQSA